MKTSLITSCEFQNDTDKAILKNEPDRDDIGNNYSRKFQLSIIATG